ncbi:TadG family pilus assembly protein [Brevundimonas sp. LF-1]|uniref:TadG family pilus assembly protein n=1 Tax=Brevundimonas sp. LF-1 TaxID=3126100 RepID=UPI0030E04586
MSAAFGALICVSAALAVDVGMVVLKGRELQGAVDLSALAAAGSLQHAEAAAEAPARANLADIATLSVQTGVYTPDPRLKPSQRFFAAEGQVNAAQVTATAPAPCSLAASFWGAMRCRSPNKRRPRGPAARRQPCSRSGRGWGRWTGAGQQSVVGPSGRPGVADPDGLQKPARRRGQPAAVFGRAGGGPGGDGGGL